MKGGNKMLYKLNYIKLTLLYILLPLTIFTIILSSRITLEHLAIITYMIIDIIILSGLERKYKPRKGV